VYSDKVNPVARSNVCPEIDPPTEPGFHAFSFTVPAAADAAPSFVISGSAEARAIEASYRERIIRYGEHDADAMREKAHFVLEEITRRLTLFGVGWRDTTASQVYTIATSIRFSPTKSSAVAPPMRASTGTSPGRRFATWNSRWTAAACGWRRFVAAVTQSLPPHADSR